MDNLEILIQAILSLKDVDKSKEQIKDELPELEKQLKSDEKARVHIVAGLDIAESKKIIQSQLDGIANQAKAPVVKVGIDVDSKNAGQNIVGNLKNIESHVNQSINNIKQATSNISLNDVSDKTIENFQKQFSIVGHQANETKSELKELFVTLNNSWYSDNLESYYDALSRIVNLTKSSAKEVVPKYQKDLITDLKSQLSDGSKVFIDDKLKEELKHILGTAKEVQKVLNSVFGAGKWSYKHSGAVPFDTLVSDDLLKRSGGLADAIKDIYNNIQQVKGERIDLFSNMSDAEATNAIENHLHSILKLSNAYIDAEGNSKTYINGLGWFDDIVTEADIANNTINNVKESIQETQNVLSKNKINGNYFYNNDELLRTIQLFDKEEDAVAILESKFKSLGATVSSVERANGSGFLEGFTIDAKAATGEIEKFTYVWKNIGTEEQPDYRYVLTNITAANSGIEKLAESQRKFKSQVDATITGLQSQAEKIRSAYSDTNSAKHIKDTEHQSQLADQYQKATDAINNLRNADNITMASMKANAQKEITALESLVKQFQNAEYAATSLRTKDVGTIKINQQNDLSKFIGQVSRTNVFSTLKSDIDTLGVSLSKVTDSKSLTAYLNQLDNVKTKFEALKSLSGTMESNLTKLQALQNQAVFRNNASNSQVVQTKADIAALISEYQKLQTLLQGNVTPEGLRQIEATLTSLNSRFITATKGAENLQTALANTNGVDKQRQKIDTLVARIEAYKKANPKAMKQFGSQIESMLSELKGGNLDKTGVDKISKQFQILRLEIQRTGNAGKGFFATLTDQAKKFSSWMTLTGVITSAWHSIKQMVGNVVELDNSLLELSKVSDLSAEGLKNITKEAYSLGEEVGKTGTQVIDAITNFKRAGFSIEDSTNFAEDALILTNVAEGINDAGEAATSLIAIMKGYHDTSPEFSKKILDSINEVSNTQAINFDDLVDGSQRLSAVAKQSGMSFEQMLGVLTGTNEVLQNIEKTANGEITIFTRLQAIQLPDEEDVMPLAKLQSTINTATKGAVDIVDQSTGELRNVYDILNDINDVWDTLDKNTQEGIAFAAAGTRQKNVFLSMMENWENVENATNSAMDSMGSSTIENQKYLDSIQGKFANLESSFQSLSQTVVNSDLIKFAVGLGTDLINLLDGLISKLGAIPTLLTAISAGLAIKNVGELLNTPVYAQPQFICA